MYIDVVSDTDNVNVWLFSAPANNMVVKIMCSSSEEVSQTISTQGFILVQTPP
jgi:hypothetical protein